MNYSIIILVFFSTLSLISRPTLCYENDETSRNIETEKNIITQILSYPFNSGWKESVLGKPKRNSANFEDSIGNNSYNATNNTQSEDTFSMEVTFYSERYKREDEEYDYPNNTYGNYTDNETYWEEYYLNSIRNAIYPKTWTWVLIFLHTIVFLIGIVGNILVCFAVYRNHSMRTVTNYFIVNLALADFLVILFCLPPSVVWDVTSTWFFGVAMCKIVLYLQSVSVTVSVLTLTFISIDRWYAICYPLQFKSTTGRAQTAICIIWIVSLSSAVPEMVYSITEARTDLLVQTIYFTQCLPSWSKGTDTMFNIIKMILSYVMPLIFMSVAYLQIIKVLWSSGNVPQAMDVSGRQVNTFAMNMNASTEGQLRSRRKAAKMLVAVVVMFAICYFPVHLLSVLRLTVGMKNTEANRALALISHWLCYANSAINPLIYNFMSGKYRKEFRCAFEHYCNRTNGESYSKSHERRSTKSSGRESRCEIGMQRLNTFDKSDVIIAGRKGN